MRKALASVVIFAFTGLLSMSLLVIFNGSSASREYMVGQSNSNPAPYFMNY